MAKKKDTPPVEIVETLEKEEIVEILEKEEIVEILEKEEIVEILEKEEIVEILEEVVEELPEPEELLLTKILRDNVGAHVFAIIRDEFKDIDPEVFDEVLRRWIARDYYIVMPPYTSIRDGYLTELGRLYARNTYNL